MAGARDLLDQLTKFETLAVPEVCRFLVKLAELEDLWISGLGLPTPEDLALYEAYQRGQLSEQACRSFEAGMRSGSRVLPPGAVLRSQQAFAAATPRQVQ